MEDETLGLELKIFFGGCEGCMSIVCLIIITILFSQTKILSRLINIYNSAKYLRKKLSKRICQQLITSHVFNTNPVNNNFKSEYPSPYEFPLLLLLLLPLLHLLTHRRLLNNYQPLIEQLIYSRNNFLSVPHS